MPKNPERRARNNYQALDKALKRPRGRPPLGKEAREVASVNIDPELKAYAIETWGGLSKAVDDLLRRHRERAER